MHLSILLTKEHEVIVLYVLNMQCNIHCVCSENVSLAFLLYIITELEHPPLPRNGQFHDKSITIQPKNIYQTAEEKQLQEPVLFRIVDALEYQPCDIHKWYMGQWCNWYHCWNSWVGIRDWVFLRRVCILLQSKNTTHSLISFYKLSLHVCMLICLPQPFKDKDTWV